MRETPPLTRVAPWLVIRRSKNPPGPNTPSDLTPGAPFLTLCPMDTLPSPGSRRDPLTRIRGITAKFWSSQAPRPMSRPCVLAALAALRTGSGLVRIAAPKEIIPAVLTLCPYATAIAWSATKIKDVLAFAEEHDALAVGPGLGGGSAVKRLVLELLERHHGPMVLDADALNVLAAPGALRVAQAANWGNIVLTPHLGEYMRLISAVMKRGANMALTPATAGEPAPGDGQHSALTRKTKSLVEDDHAPSTADGIALDLPVEAGRAEAGAAPAKSSNRVSKEEEIENQKLKIENSPPPGAARRTRPHAPCRVAGPRHGHDCRAQGAPQRHHRRPHQPHQPHRQSGDGHGRIGRRTHGDDRGAAGQKLSAFDAAVLGAHVHGAAGDLARAAIGPNAAGLLSTDLIDKIPAALSGHIGAARRLSFGKPFVESGNGSHQSEGSGHSGHYLCRAWV